MAQPTKRSQRKEDRINDRTPEIQKLKDALKKGE